MSSQTTANLKNGEGSPAARPKTGEARVGGVKCTGLLGVLLCFFRAHLNFEMCVAETEPRAGDFGRRAGEMLQGPLGTYIYDGLVARGLRRSSRKFREHVIFQGGAPQGRESSSVRGNFLPFRKKSRMLNGPRVTVSVPPYPALKAQKGIPMKLRLLSLAVLAPGLLYACGDGSDSDGENGDGPDRSGAGGNSDINLPGEGGDNGGMGLGTGFGTDGGTVVLTPAEADAIQNASCTGWAAEGESIPAVLQFVVDVSGSMDDPAPGSQNQSKWEVTRDALHEAIDDLPASVAVGMLFYPNVPSHDRSLEPKDVSDCVAVDELVEVAPLLELESPQRELIADGLDDANPEWYTPTHDAYNYALQSGLIPYESVARKFMLLITDGAPTMSENCVAPEDGVMDMPTDVIIEDIAAAYDEGIATFIIGAPGSEESSESNTDMRPWLSAAAEEGGTASENCEIDGPNFCHLDMTQEEDFGEALRAGLASIAGQVVDSCTFQVPEPPPGKTIDVNRTNVVVNKGDGTIALILPDTNGSCEEGWTFNADGNLELCPVSCDQIKLDSRATLSLTFGCAVGDIITR